ncbi:ABC transporter ATP-binding protein [Pseudoruegeria sp. HB172150]|uniref:ABC transporter ATP-binding protein n=1 Tax=Pseudoruegeria sp. HB172150 TaxID=2721164 RepID=UPI001552C454|nr:ABC transporter ATP-binding protein [Pseudoruegeria sp. HB172150]
MSHDSAIVLQDVSVTLGGNRILKNVSLDFAQGVTSGLIGPNGAGKTTLLNYICGIVPAVSGTRRILGRDATRLGTHDMLTAGLARTFQGAQFVGDLTAVENVMLGAHLRTRVNILTAALRTPAAMRSEAEIRARARVALERIGVAALADRQINELSFGDQRKVDLARALVTEAECILLDEPMAGLSAEEKDSLCEVLRELRREGGPTIVLIEHDMRVVSELCAWTAVLDAGELIAQGPTDEVLSADVVIEAYMGTGQTA